MIRIPGGPAIPETELRFTFSRSPGPGGQNVNKVETRVTLRFDVEGSASLTAEQKDRIRARLPTRITKAGVLRVTAKRHRTRQANRRAAVARFVELLAEALEERPPRRPTRPTHAAKRRRLEEKRRRSLRKRLRSETPALED